MAEEPPFLPGIMSPELAQQRADQTTGFCLRQLHGTKEFHEMLARSSRKKSRSSWLKYLASVLCTALTALVALQYLAVNELGDHLGPAAMVLDHVDDFAQPASHDQPAFSPSPSPSPALQPETAGLNSDPPCIPSNNSTAPQQPTSVSPPPPTDEKALRESTAEVGPPPQVVNAARLTVTQLLDFTPLSACASDLMFQCNEHAPAAQIEPASGSECRPEAAVTEGPTQDVPRLNVTGSPSMRPYVIAVFAQFMVILSAVALICFAERLGFAFVFTDNVGTISYNEPELAGQHSGAIVDAVETAAAILQAAAKHHHDDCIDMSTAMELPARAVPIQQQVEARDDFQSAECTRDVDHRFDVVQPASPLLYAPLLSIAKSQHDLPGSDLSLDRLRSPAPLAMAMLTPTEPPSPFPGFPALSSFASLPSPDDAAPGAKPAQPAPHPSSSSEAGCGGVEDSQGTWSSAPSPDAGEATSKNSELPGRALEADPASTSPGVAPWLIVYPLAAEAPGSSPASFEDDGGIQPQSTEAASAIFDLSRFDEDGEEVVSISSLAPKLADAHKRGDDLRAAETADDGAITHGLPRPQAKKQLPQFKAAGSDVRASDVASAAASNSSAGSAAAGRPEATVDAAVTPSWPPKPNGGGAVFAKRTDLDDAQGLLSGAAFGLDDMDEDLISYEALTLSRTLVCGVASDCVLSPSTGAADESLRQTCQEPGREYAAVAAATSVLLSGFKASSKSLLLAACAGDEPALRTAQSELYAAVAQLLEMDLAPHAYTTSVAACKALAYNNAATPVSGLPSSDFGTAGLSQDSAGSAGGSWASIGSRVASGPAAVAASPTSGGSASLPLATPAPSPSVPLATPGGGAAAAVAGDAYWPDGPRRPLPDDIDSYLTARRKGAASPSAHVLSILQDSLAFSGLLMNAAASQIASSRAELLEHVASAQEDASAWRQRALDAEARLAAMVEIVPTDVCSEDAGTEVLHVEHLGSGRGENVWVCVDLPSTLAAAAMEDVAVRKPKSAATAPLVNESKASVPEHKAVAPASDKATFGADQPSPVHADISDVVQELVSSVIKGLVEQHDVQQRDGAEGYEKSMAAGSPARVLASDVTVAAHEGCSTPTSVRSGSGSCAAADRTPEAGTLAGPHTGSDGMGSRIGPPVPSFAVRLEGMFGSSWGRSGDQWSPASNNGASDDGDGESSCCSSARRLWRPSRVSFS